MRILFLLTQDLESPSGLGRYWPIARELAALGHHVRIAALHSNFGELEEKGFIRDGVDIHYVAPMHVKKSGNAKEYYRPLRLLWVVLRAMAALSLELFKHPSDVIIVGKPHPMNGVAGWFGRVFRRKPIIVDCDDFEAGSGRFGGGWQKRIVSFFEKRVPRYGKIVTTHTQFMKDQLISWGIPENRIAYLPNGVDPARFSPPDPLKVEMERDRLGLRGKKVVAFIGTLSLKTHPVNILLAAFKIIHQAHAETVLLVVGGGEDLEGLKGEAVDLGLAEATRFVGRVPPEDVPLYYALADASTDPVFDDPAAKGRSPLKLFESWVMGVPFVSADVGDRRLLLGEPPAGVLVPVSSEEGFADGIEKALYDEKLREDIISKGKERCRAYYWEEIVHVLEGEIRRW